MKMDAAASAFLVPRRPKRLRRETAYDRRMRLACLPRALAFAALLVAAPSLADPDPGYFEQLLGATNINAATGNGGLTVAVSSYGEITVLRWPTPSYYQHVDYVSSLDANARQEPYFGARPNQGSFAGVAVDGKFAWAHSAEGWELVSQRYAADDSNQIVTTLHHPAMKVTLVYTDDVDPVHDVLVRHLAVTPDQGSSPAAVRLLYFENFSPTVEKSAFFPNDQTNLLASRDYALGMSASRRALVHFSVAGRPAPLVAPLGVAADPAAVDAALAPLAGVKGSFLIVGADAAPAQWQCGYDASPAPMGAPTDAHDDAVNRNGRLSDAPAALQHADGALAWDLGPAGGAVDLFIAAGGTLDEATATLNEAKQRGAAAIAQAAADHWKSFLATAVLPDTDDADRLRLAKRALLSVGVGQDRNTGAIVASVSSQPPYNLDWPRDGAFIDYALDVAGYHDLVGAHRHFYTTVQRKDDDELSLGGSLAGSFAMNSYGDGVPGGPIDFEIDEVGFALWMFYEHAKWIDEPARGAYLDDVYPSLALGADLLVTCVDPATNLQCAANEDDNLPLTVTLHGAIAVRLGLASAVRTANYRGRLDDARRWKARLDALDAAIEAHLGDPSLGYLGGETTLPDVGTSGPVAWTLWPAALHPADDPRMALAARQLENDYDPFFAMQQKGGAYFGKGLVPLALRYGPASAKLAGGGLDDAAREAKIRGWIDLLVKKIPTGTGHYGESFGLNSDGSYTDYVSVPHLWEATLTYLALMASYSPDKFARPELATLDVPAAGGCGCELGAARRADPYCIAILLCCIAALVRRALPRSGRVL